MVRSSIIVEDFPNCCKSYILYSFLNDYIKEEYRTNSGNWDFEIVSEEKIRNLLTKNVREILSEQWEYDQLTLFAAVTKKQLIAKSVLEQFGFREVSKTINPGSYDEEVYFMVKDLREGEDWYREEEEEYWSEEDDY
jgi:hypothetical protein